MQGKQIKEPKRKLKSVGLVTAKTGQMLHKTPMFEKKDAQLTAKQASFP